MSKFKIGDKVVWESSFSADRQEVTGVGDTWIQIDGGTARYHQSNFTLVPMFEDKALTWLKATLQEDGLPDKKAALERMLKEVWGLKMERVPGGLLFVPASVKFVPV